MDQLIYDTSIVERAERYHIQIIKRAEVYLMRLSLETGEIIRESVISNEKLSDKENSLAAETFREFIESEMRWVKDNR